MNLLLYFKFMLTFFNMPKKVLRLMQKLVAANLEVTES